MKAGRLRHRVTIRALTPTPDDQGGRSTAPTTIAAGLPCDVEDLAHSDRVASGRLTSTSTHQVTIRRRTDVVAGQEAVVTYRDTGVTVTLRIESVGHDETGRATHVYGVRVQA